MICYHMLVLQEPAFLLSGDKSQAVVLREHGTFKIWISLLCREMHVQLMAGGEN